jgi:thiamine-monophosphate kinase
MKKQPFTTVGQTGRYRLLSQLNSKLRSSSTVFQHLVHGPGDDCAVLRMDGSSKFLLISSETYVEGADFDLVWHPLQHLGYKLVSAAVSDIYAMNGVPTSLTVNLAIPNKISVEMADTLYSGFIKAAEAYNVPVTGGDLTASSSGLVISITTIGEVEESSIVYRSGAGMNDAICVTGDLGAAYAGLKILLREKSMWQDTGGTQHFEPNLNDYEYVMRRQLVPQARNDLIETFSKLSMVPTSMIDISKNLLQDLMQLCTASGKGGRIYEAAIPVALETRAVADEFQDDVDQYALQGGEDYELLFTLPEKDVNRLVEHFKDFVVIGKIVPSNKGFSMQASSGDVLHFDTSQLE